MADRIVSVDGVGAGGDEYASINAMFAGEDGLDCTATGIEGDLVVQLEAFEDTTPVLYVSGSGITTDATYGVRFVMMDDPGGKWSTSAYRLVVTGGSDPAAFGYFANLVEHLHIEGIQIYFESDDTTPGGIVVAGSPGAGSIFELDKGIILLDDNVTDKLAGIRTTEANVDHYVRNTVIYSNGANAASVGIRSAAASIDLWVYNVTIDDVGIGFELDSIDRVRAKNCRITNVVTPSDTALHTDSNNNITDGAAPTNWGAASLDSTDTPTIDYVDDSHATLTSRDYHLASTSDDGYDLGQNLSADGDMPFEDDIDGNTRTRWDAGADEFTAAAGGPGGSKPILNVLSTAVQRASTW